MLFLGDTHGDFHWWRKVVAKRARCSLQLGDMGVGFPAKIVRMTDGKVSQNAPRLSFPPELDSKDRFLRGNHDNPQACTGHPNYAGDFGYGEKPDLFWIGGGLSVDREYRTNGIDWWEDEELSAEQFDDAFRLYEKTKPRIVASHECQLSAFQAMFAGDACWLPHTSRAISALEEAWLLHQPEFWLFGHYHVTRKCQLGRTMFRCVGERQVYEIAGVSW